MIATELLIAIVDDDTAVCDSTRFLLKTYDFDVSTYQSDADFLHNGPAIACLTVDYHMPEMNGARRCRLGWRRNCARWACSEREPVVTRGVVIFL